MTIRLALSMSDFLPATIMLAREGAGGGGSSFSSSGGPDIDPKKPCDESESDNSAAAPTCTPSGRTTGTCCPPAGETSEGPIPYFNGEIQLAFDDVQASGRGILSRFRRRFSNRSLHHDEDMGAGWILTSLPSLLENGDSSLTVRRGPGNHLFFDLDASGSYTARSRLVHDSDRRLLILQSPDGGQTAFHDFNQWERLPSLDQGQPVQR